MSIELSYFNETFCISLLHPYVFSGQKYHENSLPKLLQELIWVIASSPLGAGLLQWDAPAHQLLSSDLRRLR